MSSPPRRSRPLSRPSARPACWLLLALLAGLASVPAAAQTGLPLPRFVSLRPAEVNLRTGPGNTYPVDWVYKRRHMPVEVVAEFDNWRKIRDWQGSVGWVHQSLLDGRRYGLITSEQLLLARPAPDGAPVARLMPGVIVRVQSCQSGWCRLEAGGHGGWLPHDAFWGAYPNETFD